MARIKINEKGNRTLVMAWSGNKYEMQEQIIARFQKSGDATAHIMRALDFFEAMSRQDTSVALPKFDTFREEKQGANNGVKLSDGQKHDLKKRYLIS